MKRCLLLYFMVNAFALSHARGPHEPRGLRVFIPNSQSDTAVILSGTVISLLGQGLLERMISRYSVEGERNNESNLTTEICLQYFHYREREEALVLLLKAVDKLNLPEGSIEVRRTMSCR